MARGCLCRENGKATEGAMVKQGEEKSGIRTEEGRERSKENFV